MKRYYIPEAPIACPRPRVTKQGRAYMPKTYTDWKKTVRAWLFEEWDGHVFSLPVSMKIVGVFKRRSSTPKKRPDREWKGTKPDIDNIAKSCLDVMVDVGILSDDNIVCRLVVEKHYAGLNEDPHIWIEVSSVEE